MPAPFVPAGFTGRMIRDQFGRLYAEGTSGLYGINQQTFEALSPSATRRTSNLELNRAARLSASRQVGDLVPIGQLSPEDRAAAEKEFASNSRGGAGILLFGRRSIPEEPKGDQGPEMFFDTFTGTVPLNSSPRSTSTPQIPPQGPLTGPGPNVSLPPDNGFTWPPLPPPPEDVPPDYPPPLEQPPFPGAPPLPFPAPRPPSTFAPLAQKLPEARKSDLERQSREQSLYGHPYSIWSGVGSVDVTGKNTTSNPLGQRAQSNLLGSRLGSAQQGLRDLEGQFATELAGLQTAQSARGTSLSQLQGKSSGLQPTQQQFRNSLARRYSQVRK